LNKPNIEVCLSPLLFSLLDQRGKNVVVIDVLRATSTICNALTNGAEAVIPVESLEECLAMEGSDLLKAAERNGQKPEGFAHGNSPLEYTPEIVKGKTIVLTTTNGTKCIKMSAGADKIVAGSFLNLDAIVSFINQEAKDTILFCAGWKDQFNLEDTLFAGAVIDRLKYDFEYNNDAAFAARHLYVNSEEHLMDVVKFSSHYQRLSKHGVTKDIEFCLTPNQSNIIPILNQHNKLVPYIL
jgi:2-phosphosulfolactate phosphatase